MPDAITPYNFVPMPSYVREGETPPPANKYDAYRHTGYFEIQLTTLTPLYTRAALGVNRPGAEAFPPPIASGNDNPPTSDRCQPADFFHRGDAARTPVLSGSSLRGMFRSVFEIITYSHMEFVSQRRLFFRSFAESAAGGLRQHYDEKFGKLREGRLFGGILMEDEEGMFLRVSTRSPQGYVLVSAQEATRMADRSLRRNQAIKVGVTLTAREHNILKVPIADMKTLGNGTEWLIVPGRDIKPRRWHQVILTAKGTEYEDFRISSSVYKDYLNWGEMAHGSRFGSTRDDTPRKLEVCQPAFGLLGEEGSLIVIGANMMMPMRYTQPISEIAERMDGSKTVEAFKKELPEWDMTQAVFGRVSEESATKNRRGRVFFEDANCGTEAPWLQDAQGDVKIPNVLSNPKPTSFQVYLTGPKGSERHHWDDTRAILRGHKRFWHRSPMAAMAALHSNEGELSTQETRIRPVRENVVFTGRVRFENLSSAELGALYASIRLPQGLAHKFGMGKNLGLGSLQVNITNTVLFDMTRRYSALSQEGGRHSEGESKDILQQAYRDFAEKVYPQKNTIWGNTRMQAFAALLSWKTRVPDEETGQITLPPRNAPQDAQEFQWKYRDMLPLATELFGQKTDVRDIVPLSEPKAAPQPTVTPKATSKQPTTPPPSTRAYQQGDTIFVTVLSREDYATGTVQLEDGTIIAKANTGICTVGQRLKMRVVKAANGVIKELRRA